MIVFGLVGIVNLKLWKVEVFIMGRKAKDGEYICCKLNKHVADMLNQYSDKTAIPKTALIERAVELYISSRLSIEEELKYKQFTVDDYYKSLVGSNYHQMTMAEFLQSQGK